MENDSAQVSKAAAPKNTALGILTVSVLAILFSLGPKLGIAPAAPVIFKPEVPPAFANLSLSARAVYVLDAKTGKKIFSINGDAQLPLASLTKIMMAVTAMSLLPENAVVTIRPDFLKTEGNSGLYGNEKWRLKDLLDLTLVES